MLKLVHTSIKGEFFKKERVRAMQIRKIYKNVNPGLLFDEVKGFATKQGVSIGEETIQSYSLPTDSSSSIRRGTIIFHGKGKTGETETEYLRAHIEGSETGETKLILDINTELFPKDKVTALQNDLDFIFSSYEIKSLHKGG